MIHFIGWRKFSRAAVTGTVSMNAASGDSDICRPSTAGPSCTSCSILFLRRWRFTNQWLLETFLVLRQSNKGGDVVDERLDQHGQTKPSASQEHRCTSMGCWLLGRASFVTGDGSARFRGGPRLWRNLFMRDRCAGTLTGSQPRLVGSRVPYGPDEV